MSRITRRAVRPGELSGARVERQRGMWRLRSFAAAKQVLQARGATTQAGFTAEWIPQGVLSHHPLLLSDGPSHDEQRKQVGRFFAPRVIGERHEPWIRRLAQARVDAAVRRGGVRMDQLALTFSVEVTRQIVGLDRSSVHRLARRLEGFFRQPDFDLTLPRLGRTPGQWAQAARKALGPLLGFLLLDVRPAVRARRRHPKDDVISHLLDHGYTLSDILVESVTFGTAGMVTTREFISMALWHLLDDAPLRRRYLAASEEGRRAVLAEIIRVDPVVGHLYRRASQDLTVEDGDAVHHVAAGDLIDIRVREANADRPAPEHPDPHDTGLSFGAGTHRCPGEPLAMAETEILVTAVLRAEPSMVGEPTLGWDDLVAGYTVRDLHLAFGSTDAHAKG